MNRHRMTVCISRPTDFVTASYLLDIHDMFLLGVNVTHTPAVIVDGADRTRPRVTWQRSVDTMVDSVDDLG